jgi:hydroxyethylthiazole kinase-like uncharacterized protein yjeF
LRAKEILTTSERIIPTRGTEKVKARQLFGLLSSRAHEVASAAPLPSHALMARAGLAVARLAMATAPHASSIWIPCGPGNNGGDGFEAACHLKAWGKNPVVTYIGNPAHQPLDAKEAFARAVAANVTITDTIPEQYDFCIDALFGIGVIRGMDARYATLVGEINSKVAPVLSIDTPSGLDAETGLAGATCVKADITLCLLSLKPGLFTADGRQFAGEVWLNALDVADAADACAQLNPSYSPRARVPNSHKGTFGDVGIVGGAHGMAGAALLAARAALHGGAGRVYLASLDPHQLALGSSQPEIMHRPLAEMDYTSMTVIAGCGGGTAIQEQLESIITCAAKLVLDADALNAIAKSPVLQNLIRQRKPHTTVLTPHPLEAARLMAMQSAEVQAHRIDVAIAIANRYNCTVVLKGSGSIIARPDRLPRINTSGSARLATAGTGDVLAGLIGAYLAADEHVFERTCEAVFWHGHVSDQWRTQTTMTAQDLILAL